MIIEYQLIESELLQALRFTTKKLSKSGKRAFIFYIISGIAQLGISLAIFISFISDCTPLFSKYYFADLFRDSFPPILGTLLFIFGIILFVKAYRYPDQYYKKWLKKPINRTVLLKHALEFLEQGISFTDSNQNYSLIVWKTFHRILQTDDFFLLEIQEDRFVTIPKTHLSTEEITYLDNKLKAHFKDRYPN